MSSVSNSGGSWSPHTNVTVTHLGFRRSINFCNRFMTELQIHSTHSISFRGFWRFLSCGGNFWYWEHGHGDWSVSLGRDRVTVDWWWLSFPEVNGTQCFFFFSNQMLRCFECCVCVAGGVPSISGVPTTHNMSWAPTIWAQAHPQCRCTNVNAFTKQTWLGTRHQVPKFLLS